MLVPCVGKCFDNEFCVYSTPSSTPPAVVDQPMDKVTQPTTTETQGGEHMKSSNVKQLNGRSIINCIKFLKSFEEFFKISFALFECCYYLCLKFMPNEISRPCDQQNTMWQCTTINLGSHQI